MDIAEHIRTRNHTNIIPINDRSYVKICRQPSVKNIEKSCERYSSDDSENDESDGRSTKKVKLKKCSTHSCHQCMKTFSRKDHLNPNQLPPKWVKNKCVSKCLNSSKTNNAIKKILGGDIFDT